jgi:hypothetical protein
VVVVVAVQSLLFDSWQVFMDLPSLPSIQNVSTVSFVISLSLSLFDSRLIVIVGSVNGEEQDRHGGRSSSSSGAGGAGGRGAGGGGADNDGAELDLQTMKKFVTYCRR